MKKIDRQKILPPKLTLSNEALKQIDLRMRYEPNMENKVFRIHIDGKGCDGFTFGAYFTVKDQDDFEFGFSSPLSENQIKVVVEPFTAYYAPVIWLDYKFDPGTDEEGFEIKIEGSEQFSGKFFNDQEAQLPPVLDPSVQ
jgi:Fe-S cluster assembly iron-binding protein IscA